MYTGQFLPYTPFARHVFFWLKDKDDNENYNKMLKSLKELKKIEEVKFLHMGMPSINDIDFEARATDTTYTFIDAPATSP